MTWEERAMSAEAEVERLRTILKEVKREAKDPEVLFPNGYDAHDGDAGYDYGLCAGRWEAAQIADTALKAGDPA